MLRYFDSTDDLDGINKNKLKLLGMNLMTIVIFVFIDSTPYLV